MQLILIRHAESSNNSVASDGTRTKEELDRIRHPDAPLTELGVRQAADLGVGILAHLNKPIPGKLTSRPRVHVCVSPMLRTLLTAKPLLVTLHDHQSSGGERCVLTNVEVVPHIFEKGGCFSAADGGEMVGYPGMRQEEIQAVLPRAYVPDTLKDGWWHSTTKETKDQFELRIEKTVSWIKEMAHSDTCDVLILVIHRGLAASIISSFCGVSTFSLLHNTGVNSITLHPIGTDDHDCICVLDWINCVDHLSGKY